MKNFNFIVNRICANTPPCCSKRASRFVWVLVLMLTLGVGQMWGYTGTFTKCTGTLSSGYYVIGNVSNSTMYAIDNTVGTSWIKYTSVTISSSKITNPSDSVVWYYDADAGTIKNVDNTNYIYWTSGNVGCCGTTSYVHDIQETPTSGIYNIKSHADNTRILAKNGTSGYRYYAGTQTKEIQFWKAASSKTLSSLSISGDLSNKSYEEGEELDFTGLTVTGSYSDSSTDDVTDDVKWSFSPALAVGTTSYTVTATIGNISANMTIKGVTVTEHVVTPGEYEVTLSNSLWDVTSGQQATTVTNMSGSSNDISFSTTKGSSQIYTTSAQTRFYGNGTSNATLTITVPNGYVIKSIVFAEPSSDKTWNGSISVNSGTYTANSKSWAGKVNSVTFTFGAQNRIATATVTYEAACTELASINGSFF